MALSRKLSEDRYRLARDVHGEGEKQREGRKYGGKVHARGAQKGPEEQILKREADQEIEDSCESEIHEKLLRCRLFARIRSDEPSSVVPIAESEEDDTERHRSHDDVVPYDGGRHPDCDDFDRERAESLKECDLKDDEFFQFLILDHGSSVI